MRSTRLCCLWSPVAIGVLMVKVWIRIPSCFRLFDVLWNSVRIRGLRYHCWCWL